MIDEDGVDPVELRFPARVAYLALVRSVITTLAQSVAGLQGPRLEDLRLAVSEACVNAVEAYGRQARPEAMVSLRCTAEPGRITVEVRDEAGGFDPDRLVEHPPVDTPERLQFERGLGIPLMRALADEAEFIPEGGGTTVRLVVSERRAAVR